ncbi:MAG TPA: isoprenylcysteine carboxylmethyltransferase family protein [Vicinamibacterales bacterium]|nr:isoprenylcysteine carboxylmethyltransferase family protein [Vicinamibacterales bacterium]
MSTQLLARFRVALGWVVAPLVLIAAEPTAGSIAVGMSIAAGGEALRIWAAGHLNKAREVTASGPYRWFAHPLYAGSSVMGLGLGIASHSLIVIALIAAYLWLTLRAAVASEEAYLRRTFGDQYDRYRQGLRERARRGGDASRAFSVSRAIANREHRAIIGLVLVVLLLVLKATYNGSL